MSFLGWLKPKPATAVLPPATAVLPPGWQILMDGNTPHYHNFASGNVQTEFPQSEPAPEPERELPAGWKKEKWTDGYDGSKTWVEYVSTEVPGVRQGEFPTAPSRALNPLWEEIKVGNTTMYRSRINKANVSGEFQPASPLQIAAMWKEFNKPDQPSQWRGGKRKQSKQSKRKQSKRKQSKRKQSKRKQSRKSH